mgnify:CR=1 FL=1
MMMARSNSDSDFAAAPLISKANTETISRMIPNVQSGIAMLTECSKTDLKFDGVKEKPTGTWSIASKLSTAVLDGADATKSATL